MLRVLLISSGIDMLLWFNGKLLAVWCRLQYISVVEIGSKDV